MNSVTHDAATGPPGHGRPRTVELGLNWAAWHDRVRVVRALSPGPEDDPRVTAAPYQQLVLEAPRAARHRLGGTALVAAIVILVAVAIAVLATAEWIAPASSTSIPG